MPVNMQGIVADPLQSPDRMVEIGPSIRVHVGFDPELAPKSGLEPESEARNVWALIDKGAYVSCMDPQLTERINLSPVDTTTIAGAGCVPDKMPICLAQKFNSNLGGTLYGAIFGVHLVQSESPYKVLPRRHFLRHYLKRHDGSADKFTVARKFATSPVIPQSME